MFAFILLSAKAFGFAVSYVAAAAGGGYVGYKYGSYAERKAVAVFNAARKS